MKKKTLVICLLSFFMLSFAPSAIALSDDTPWFLERDYGGQIGLGEANLELAIIRILTYALSLLTLIALAIIIYGGFVWMTAAGNEEKISKAKKTLSAAAIGLIVVMLSWAIVIFVATTIHSATTRTNIFGF